MKKNVFRQVTVNGKESDNDAIINVFSKMVTGQLKCDLKLLNYCGEVPVSYGLTITAVDKDSVELLVHEHQALIIKHDKYTIVKSDHLHNELGVHCIATYVNVPKRKVILQNFAYAQIRSEKREAVRVKVNGILPVRFSYENVNFEGSMVDLSGNSISINSNAVPEIKTDQSGILFFALTDTLLEVLGSFVKSSKNGTGGHICVFQIKPDWMSDGIIDKYISHRQVEIIQQLKFLFSG